MHIPDGIVAPQVSIGGYAIAGGLMWYSLKQIEKQTGKDAGKNSRIPQASLLTAAFFAASSIHIPIPPTSVHFVLNGLLGAVLGWYAFPAIAIGLFFQAVMFQHGGLSTLGVNLLLMGTPALLAGVLFHSRFLLALKGRFWTGLFGFLSGSMALALSATIFFSTILMTLPANIDRQTEQAALLGLLVAHIPLAILEGVFTTMIVVFLQRVKPELIERH